MNGTPEADGPPPYSARVRALFRSLPRGGAPADPTGWASAAAAEPLSATRVRWYLRLDAAGRLEARWAARGCPHLLAAAGALAERLDGSRPEDAWRLVGADPGFAKRPGGAGPGDSVAGAPAHPPPPAAVAVPGLAARLAAELDVPVEKLGRLFAIEDAVRGALLMLRGAPPA